MEKTLDTKTVFECPIFKVEEAVVEMPDGSTQKRWYVVNPDVVLLIPIDADGNIILIKEWASAAQRPVLKLVAGKVDDGEEPQQAAQRELREESGYAAHDLEYIGNIPAAGNWQKQNKHFYIARDLYPSPLETGDEFEMAEILPHTPEHVLALIEDGTLRGDIAVALKQVILKK